MVITYFMVIINIWLLYLSRGVRLLSQVLKTPSHLVGGGIAQVLGLWGLRG